LLKGGGSLISPQLQEAIYSHLRNNSEIAANRLTKSKEGVDISVRYLHDNKTEVHKTFEYKDFVARSTFLKYLNQSNEYKNPVR
jgi:hypothetical protein